MSCRVDCRWNFSNGFFRKNVIVQRTKYCIGFTSLETSSLNSIGEIVWLFVRENWSAFVLICSIGLTFDEPLCTISIHFCVEMMATGHGRISQDARSIRPRTFVHHEEHVPMVGMSKNDIFVLSKVFWTQCMEIREQFLISSFSSGSPFSFASCSFFGPRTSFQDANG